MTINDLLRDAYGYEIAQKDIDEALKWVLAFRAMERALVDRLPAAACGGIETWPEYRAVFP